MNPYCIKCSMFKKTGINKTKREVDETIIFILIDLIVILKSLKLLIRKEWVNYWNFKLNKNTESKNRKFVKTKKEEQCFIKMYDVWLLKIRIYYRASSRKITKYDQENSVNWSVSNVIIDKSCFNSNIFIQMFIKIMEMLKKRKDQL